LRHSSATVLLAKCPELHSTGYRHGAIAISSAPWELVEKGAETASEAQDNVLLSAALPKALRAVVL
jgi:hypothetical protein